MKKDIFKLIITIIIVLSLGILFMVMPNFFNKSHINLYDGDFNNFEFENFKVYDYELEAIADYFYKKTSSDRDGDTDHYYYYNARLKNKYSDNIYVICELIDGARTNMIVDNNYTISRSGMIRKASSEITNLQNESLSRLVNMSNARVYNIYFVLTLSDIIQIIGGTLILTTIVIIFVGIGHIRYKYKLGKNARNVND